MWRKFRRFAYMYRQIIGLWVFRTSWPKMDILGDKIGEGVVRCWLLTNSFFLLGVLTSVSILKCDRESARRRTDAKRFYNLSHAICYSHGTDNKLKSYKLTELTNVSHKTRFIVCRPTWIDNNERVLKIGQHLSKLWTNV